MKDLCAPGALTYVIQKGLPVFASQLEGPECQQEEIPLYLSLLLETTAMSNNSMEMLLAFGLCGGGLSRKQAVFQGDCWCLKLRFIS